MRNPRELANTSQRVYEEFPPSSDWTQDSDCHFLLIDLPGFKREEIKVRVDNLKKVTVSGERQISENKYSRFKQIYQMPDDSDVDAVNGRFDGGVLFIIIPKKKLQHSQDEIPGENEIKNDEKVTNLSKEDDKARSTEKRDKKPGDGDKGRYEKKDKKPDDGDKGRYEKKDKQGKEEEKISDKKPEVPKISDKKPEEPKISDKKTKEPKTSDDGDKSGLEKKDDQGKGPKISDYLDKGKSEIKNELSKEIKYIKDVVNKGKGENKDEPSKEKANSNDVVDAHKYEKKGEQRKEPKKVDGTPDHSSDIHNEKKEGWAGIAKVEEDWKKVTDRVKNKEEMEALVKTTMENIIQNKKLIITAMVAFSIGFCISRKL